MSFKVKFFGGRLTKNSSRFFRSHDSYVRKIVSNRIASSGNHRRRAAEISNTLGRVAGGKRAWVN